MATKDCNANIDHENPLLQRVPTALPLVVHRQKMVFRPAELHNTKEVGHWVPTGETQCSTTRWSNESQGTKIRAPHNAGKGEWQTKQKTLKMRMLRSSGLHR